MGKIWEGKDEEGAGRQRGRAGGVVKVGAEVAEKDSAVQQRRQAEGKEVRLQCVQGGGVKDRCGVRASFLSSFLCSASSLFCKKEAQ